MAQCEGVCLYILFQCLISVHKLTPASYGAVIWLGSVIPTEIGGYQKWTTLVKEMICNAIPLCLFKDSSSYWSLFLRQFFIIFSLSTILMTHKYAVVFPIFKGNNLDSMFHSSCLYNKLLKSCLHNFCTSWPPIFSWNYLFHNSSQWNVVYSLHLSNVLYRHTSSYSTS